MAGEPSVNFRQEADLGVAERASQADLAALKAKTEAKISELAESKRNLRAELDDALKAANASRQAAEDKCRMLESRIKEAESRASHAEEALEDLRKRQRKRDDGKIFAENASLRTKVEGLEARISELIAERDQLRNVSTAWPARHVGLTTAGVAGGDPGAWKAS